MSNPINLMGLYSQNPYTVPGLPGMASPSACIEGRGRRITETITWKQNSAFASLFVADIAV
jgi:hypothetical protein